MSAARDRLGPVLGALVCSLALVGSYLLLGGASYRPLEVADPCVVRGADQLEQRETLEAIALSALDGAACELQVTREELVLALADEQASAEFAAEHNIDDSQLEAAVRAGLVRAVDDAAAAGRIGGLEETILREVAERAPVGQAIAALRALPGDDDIQSLLDLLGDAGGVDLPSAEELPGLDDLQQLLP